MPVAMMVDNPKGSQEIYESVRERLGLDRPAGGIFHVAGPSPNGGWRVIEVWESEEDAQRFVERLRPAFEAVGRPRAPSARALARAQLHDVAREEAASRAVRAGPRRCEPARERSVEQQEEPHDSCDDNPSRLV